MHTLVIYIGNSEGQRSFGNLCTEGKIILKCTSKEWRRESFDWIFVVQKGTTGVLL